MVGGVEVTKGQWWEVWRLPRANGQMRVRKLERKGWIRAGGTKMQWTGAGKNLNKTFRVFCFCLKNAQNIEILKKVVTSCLIF